MNTKIMVSLTMSALVLASGCTRSIIHPMLNTPVYPPSLTSADYHSDSKILGALVVLNHNEIAAAELAQSKATSVEVKKFARYMYHEHTQNLHETKSMGILPEKGRVAMTLETQGRQLLHHLKHLEGRSFNKAYIHAMVKDHRSALSLMNRLIQEAHHPFVKKQLEITRHHIAMHLQDAEALQRNMKK